jgi:basic membrane lipoprotein Med (substrate-binding protein (PBP1-ABC) superfamily)
MQALRRIAAGIAISTLLISLSACASTKTETPDHKAKTTACLIRSVNQVPGTPDKQLAADLVEAQVTFGLAVREVQIPSGVVNISVRLLTALQSGCVLMVSANTDYLDDLASFARLHSKMMVLFVGGSIASVDQPANFRWIADDALSGAKLAGFASAGKSTDDKVRLFIQPSYFQAKSIEEAFSKGVTDYNRVANSNVALVVYRATNAKALSSVLKKIEPTSVFAIFAGKSVWQGLTSFESTGPMVFASDIQFGNTQKLRDSRVIASVERDTSKALLRAVSSLLDRKVSSAPKYRVSQTLKFNLIVLRTLDAGVFDGTLTERIDSYKKGLISAKSN